MTTAEPDLDAAPPAAARSRILDAALRLMSEQGASAASMRQLAAAAGLNVATLYHYFPSKADLVRAVLEERRWGERLNAEPPPVDRSIAAGPRLVGLVEWLWRNALAEESAWRLLVGEAIRGEAVAISSAQELVDALEATFAGWFADSFPELQVAPDVAARLLRGQVFALVAEHLAMGTGTDADAVRQRADDLAALLFR
jgi:AcrR family transcriptional regulator